MLVSRVTAARCAEAKAVFIPLPGQNSTCRRISESYMLVTDELGAASAEHAFGTLCNCNADHHAACEDQEQAFAEELKCMLSGLNVCIG